MIKKLADRIIEHALATPYFHLTGYMHRWWLVPYCNSDKPGCGPVQFRPRPFAWLLQRLDIAARIHCILRSDHDRAPHDHPWWYLTIILRGGYWEVTPVFDDWGRQWAERRKWYGPGSILFRRAKSLHRLELPHGKKCWTLFVTGKRSRDWGYREPDTGEWVHYRDYNHHNEVLNNEG